MPNPHRHEDWNIWYRSDGTIDSARLLQGKIIAEWDEHGELIAEYDPSANPLSKAFFDSDPPLSSEPDPLFTDSGTAVDWKAFRDWQGTSPAVVLVMGSAAQNLPPHAISSMTSALYAVGQDPTLWEEVLKVWNGAIATGGFSPEQIAAIESDVRGMINAVNLNNQIQIGADAMLSVPDI